MKSAKIALAVVMLVVGATMVAHAQTQIFVPGNANGYFGNPVDLNIPLVPALVVTGPGTITVTYVSGTVTDSGGVNTGPDGVSCSGCAQLPLLEAVGAGQVKEAPGLDSLIGVFVPAARVSRPGFNAIDGTKNATPVGILPNTLLFIGTGKTFSVTQAGTLFLGINDNWVSDNGGGFNVTVSVQ